jgi:predicted MFS family arabinose efflux permease
VVHRRLMAELGKNLDEIELTHPAGSSAWAPLCEPVFRSLWLAAVISYTGTWIQIVGSGWLMASLTASPLMVSLVQAAGALPVFSVILLAGALADTVDRRRLLLITQSWMVVAAASLGILTLLGHVTPWMLLAFTFLLGLGSVMNDPAWQAITPEIVSHRNFAQAVALNSVGFNVARAVGPALGGLIIMLAGSGATFLVNAASFFGVIFVLYSWKRPRVVPERRERVFRAVRTGLEYFRQSPPVRAVLVRTAVFSVAASALLALLPLMAKPFGSVGFGIMLGCFGAGALAGAAILPSLRRRMSINKVVALATLVFAAATFATPRLHTFAEMCAALFAGGGAWITIVAILNVSAQTMCPAWLRARALSMYLLVLQGGMASGSAIWGAIGESWGIATALSIAALTLVAGLTTARHYRLQTISMPVPTAAVNGTAT